MTLLLTLACSVFVWVLAFAALKLLEHHLGPRLLDLLERLNISVTIFHVRFETTRFNSSLKRWGAPGTGQQCVAWWFQAGSYFGCVLMALSEVLLCFNLYWSIFPSAGQEPVLAPLIPGMNVPFSQTPYLFVALIISAAIHEFGHAWAASAWSKGYQSVGIFLMFIYPGAFVNFAEGFDDLSPRKQLQIYCAGAWHNAVVAGLALLLIVAQPLLLSPLYSTGDGVVVQAVLAESPLAGHLHAHDVIVALDMCDVRSQGDWEGCLLAMIQEAEEAVGYCTTELALELTAGNGLDCCTQLADYAGPMQCFNTSHPGAGYCMPARQVATQPYCLSDPDCTFGAFAKDGVCAKPVSLPDERMIKVQLADERFVIFLGHPSLLYYYGNYVPHSPLVGLYLPHYLERLLGFLISVSSALALLNMAPVYYFDGEHACLALFKLLLPSLAKRKRDMAVRWVLLVTSGLLAVNILASFFFMYKNASPI